MTKGVEVMALNVFNKAIKAGPMVYKMKIKIQNTEALVKRFQKKKPERICSH